MLKLWRTKGKKMKKITLSISISAIVLLSSIQAIEKTKAAAPEKSYPSLTDKTFHKGIIPSEEDMINALKEALQVGASNAADALHKTGGYLNDPIIKIPFPPDAIKIADELRRLGFGPQVDKFIETMNRGAEDAAVKAAPIFIDAIKGMTLIDAKNILLGPDNSATTYFKNKTTNGLYAAFSPEIKASLDKVGATKAWSTITTKYDRIPFVRPIQTDLVKYATNKALDGLFVKIADQEKSIRKSTVNPKQVTDNLKKVFDWAAKMK